MYIAETLKHKGHVIKIVHDDMADNPLDDEGVVKIVEWHKRYDFGNCDDFADPEEFEEYCRENKVHRLPVYLYEHGGVTISTAAFSCSWDSGQVGWVFVTDAEAQKDLYPDEDGNYTEALKGTVEVVDQYMQGNSWGYRIFKTCGCCGHETEEVESCWGFLGDPEGDVMDEAKASVPDAPNPNVLAI